MSHKTDENVREIVKETAIKLNVEIKNEDIAAAYRLPAKSEIPLIIVKFVHQETKPKMIGASKKHENQWEHIKLEARFPLNTLTNTFHPE